VRGKKEDKASYFPIKLRFELEGNLCRSSARRTLLDRAYSTPQIIDQRRRFRAVVAARPGEVGLDVGCGAGHLACEIAGEVAPGGRIVAVDKSAIRGSFKGAGCK
jgi:2-polyprenyl-3-methyl-5-hydroxy-6-metoxy-1,4-benzoquinol methylase